MKTPRLFLACAALCGLTAIPAFAQGTAFTYQGVLSQSGAPANGTNDLTFTLYNAFIGGSTVGNSNVVNDLVITNGLFTVTLDFGAVVFDGTPRSLQIAVRPGASTGAYTILAPRQPVTPTPYAIYAGGASASGLSGTIGGSQIASGAIGPVHLSNSVSLWNRSGSNIFFTNGNVGIGTANPQRSLEIGDATVGGSEALIRLGSSSGVGAHRTWDIGVPQTGEDLSGVGYSFVIDDLQWGSDPEFIVRWGSGNVGIGVNNPGAKLHVAGSGFFGMDGGALESSAGSGVRIFQDGTLNGNIFAYDYTAAASRNLILQQPGGNVGIGAMVPTTKLEVAGTVTATSYIGDGSGLSGVAKLSGGNTFTGNQNISSGNVGIGTTVPDRPLAIRGEGVNGDWLSLKDTSGATKWHLNNSQGGLDFVQSGIADARLFLATNGNVGIGTTTPGSSLEVVGGIRARGGAPGASGVSNNGYAFNGTGDNDSGLFSPGDGQLTFFINSTERVRLDPNGNVGIGTTNPATKLDVSGEITTTAVNITSDRNAKEQFKPVNAREVLDKVARLPISEWQYKSQSDARHIGPMAQDFREAFALGRDEKHITSVDADGVALAAIQGLNEKFVEQTREKEARIRELEKTVAELKELVGKLAGQQNGGAR